MKQNKWQRLAAIGLCGSLLVNAFSGVTAVAETVTIESSPTAESSVKEETQASSETQETTTETSREVAEKTEQPVEVQNQETVDTSQDAFAENNQSKGVPPSETTPISSEANPSQIKPRWVPLKTVVYPNVQYDFVDETGTPFTEQLVFSGNYQAFKGGDFNSTPVPLPAPYNKLSAQNNGSGSYILSVSNGSAMPFTEQTIANYGGGGTNPVVKYRTMFILDKLNIATPLKFVDSIEYDFVNSNWALYLYTGFNATTGIFDNSVEEAKTFPMSETSKDAKFQKNAQGYFEIIQPSTFAISSGDFTGWTIPGYSNIRLFGFDGTNTIKSKMIYKVTRKQVTEKFVDGTGVAITPPTGFTQNKKTPMTSNNFTYTSAKALPDTYKAGGKTYKFKGWYKGKTKPATLKTTKTPSYAVTYDDNDDMTAVYEEVVPKTVTVPAVDYLFGFINEKGVYVYDAKLTATITEVSGGTVKNGSAITSVPEGVFQKLTIPSKALTYTETSPVFYGVTKANVQVPKYYKQPTVKPGSYFTGPLGGYPMATIALQNIANGQKSNASVDGSRFDVVPNESAKPNNYLLVSNFWASDTTKTAFSKALSMTTTVNAPSFFTTEDKMFYFLENRRITENFVDSNGTKITPPTGFTQGKQTVIDSDSYTFKQAGTLPDTYKAGTKTYKFKGWYKGKTKPATLETSKTPSYAVTYDDNDDLTVVYEDQTSITLPGASYQFGFIDDSGKIVDPSKVGLTYDLWLLDKKVSTVTNKNLSGVNIGNVKSMSIPDKEIPLPVYGDGNSLFSPINMTFSLPKYYSNMTINTGLNSSYPLPVVTEHRSNEAPKEVPTTDASFALQKVADQSYTTAYTNSNPVAPNVKFPILYRRYAVPPMGLDPYTNYSTFSGPVYYTLTQRRVTEHFVDNNGNEIPAPTGFTQGKQTVIDSENFTYTSANALPDTYTAGDKSYKFKGWYKGIDKTALETTKTPSYAVTYDNKDDMTAVYEEVQETTVHPGFYAEFVDEQGKAFTNPLTLSGNYTEFLRKNATSPFEATGSLYPMAGSKEATVANRYKIETKQNVLIPNNYELLPDPATGVLNRGFALNNFGITNELKYVDKVEATTKTITLYDYDTISDIGTNLLSDAATTSLNSFETTLNKETNNTFSVKAKWGQSGLSRDILPNLLFLTSANSKPRLFGFDGTSDYKQTINYKITRKQVTENFVDATGAKITPPTGFTQGKQIPMTSNSFTYTSANVLPDTYTAGDKSYKFKGWYKGIDKTALETTKTPSYAVTYDDKDDMTAVYEEVQPTAEMTVSRLLEVIPNGSSMVWTVRLKNTSEVPLTNIKLAPTAKWAAGISAPTQLAVRIGSTSKIIPVTAEQWRTGVNLGVEIPVNGEALVTVNTAKITGEPRQLLTAEMTASGNFSAATASNFVRIQGEDQTITPAPVEEGFISTPTFDFGKITISSSAKQYGLKKAADYYGNGTRNPYLRIKKSQPNWQLTAQLSQLKASTDSLPTSTRLLLGNADVAAIENYNQVTESTNKVGVTKALTLTSDGTSTPVILNNQFTGNDVYQLDFDFASVKLDVPANQGKINEKYQGTVTWNLVTGP
ncbi:WxL domain-containing protein [Enterococcus faecalis]